MRSWVLSCLAVGLGPAMALLRTPLCCSQLFQVLPLAGIVSKTAEEEVFC